MNRDEQMCRPLCGRRNIYHLRNVRQPWNTRNILRSVRSFRLCLVSELEHHIELIAGFVTKKIKRLANWGFVHLDLGNLSLGEELHHKPTGVFALFSSRRWSEWILTSHGNWSKQSKQQGN